MSDSEVSHLPSVAVIDWNGLRIPCHERLGRRIDWRAEVGVKNQRGVLGIELWVVAILVPDVRFGLFGMASNDIRNAHTRKMLGFQFLLYFCRLTAAGRVERVLVSMEVWWPWTEALDSTDGTQGIFAAFVMCALFMLGTHPLLVYTWSEVHLGVPDFWRRSKQQ